MIEFANTLIPKHNIAIVVNSSECMRYRIDIYLMKPYDGVNKVSKIYATEELMLNEYTRIKNEL